MAIYLLMCISLSVFFVNKVAYGQVQEGTPCETPRKEYGLCINIKSCDRLLELLRTQRSDPTVRTYLQSSTCGYIGNLPMVCCPAGTAKSRQPESEEKDNGVDSGELTPNDGTLAKLPEPPDCGFSNASLPRIVGGVDAKLYEFPWIVSLGYKNAKNPDFPKWLCGGTLITDRHILTAAHCVHNRNDLYIARVGELDLFDDEDGANPIDIPLTKAKIHENYSPVLFTNDIAILTLARKPEIPEVYPVCLPWEEKQRNIDFVKLKRSGIVAGWGALYFNGPSSSKLKYVQLPIISNENCKRAFGNRSVIDDRIMCAGFTTGGKDACQGDSGGPLMNPTLEQASGRRPNFRFYQIGIVSYGFRCAEAGYPGVYTRVTNFLDWIRRNID